MANHSSSFAWRRPWTEDPGQAPTVHRVAKSRTQLSDGSCMQAPCPESGFICAC